MDMLIYFLFPISFRVVKSWVQAPRVFASTGSDHMDRTSPTFMLGREKVTRPRIFSSPKSSCFRVKPKTTRRVPGRETVLISVLLRAVPGDP